VKARVSTSIKLDPSRPEYHRVVVTWDDEHNQFMAHSTGPQASSRLLSLRAANGLLEIPSGSGSIAAGTLITVLLTAPLDQPQPKEVSEAERKAMEAAAHVGCRCHLSDTGTGVAIHAPHHHGHAAHSGHSHTIPSSTITGTVEQKSVSPASSSSSATTATTATPPSWEIRVGLLTISDRCHHGQSTDLSGVSPVVSPSNRTFTFQ
jgi:hypothetical protein